MKQLTKAAYSVRELVEIMPLGRNSIYEALYEGRLKAKKFGKRIMFLAPDVEQFLLSLEDATFNPETKETNEVEE